MSAGDIFPTAETAIPTPLISAPNPVAPEEENIDALIMQWHSLTEKLDIVKKGEMVLRKRIEASGLFDITKEKGTQNYDLGRDYVLSLVRKQTVSVANKENEAIKTVQLMKNIGPVSADRAARLFKFSASLQEKVYEELNEAEKAVVDPIITRKQASPSLSLKVPKS